MVALGGFSRVVKEISAKRSVVDVVDVAVVVQERSHCVCVRVVESFVCHFL